MKITKKARTEFVKLKLKTNTTWAVNGMLKIFDTNQTEYERQVRTTREDNGIGFNGVDGNILSSFSQQIKNGRVLSEKQLKVVMKAMPKYHKQLIELSDQSKLDGMVLTYKSSV